MNDLLKEVTPIDPWATQKAIYRKAGQIMMDNPGQCNMAIDPKSQRITSFAL